MPSGSNKVMAKTALIMKSQRTPKFKTRATTLKLCGRPRAYIRSFGCAACASARSPLKGECRASRRRAVGMYSDTIAGPPHAHPQRHRAEHEKCTSLQKLKSGIASCEGRGLHQELPRARDKKQNMLRSPSSTASATRSDLRLVRVSTPGRRVYVTHDTDPVILAGMGVALVSTPRAW